MLNQFRSNYTGNCWISNGAEWKDLGAKFSPRRFAAGVTTHHQFTYILGGETMKNVFNTLEVLLGPDLKKSVTDLFHYHLKFFLNLIATFLVPKITHLWDFKTLLGTS